MSKKKGQTQITIFPDWCKGCGVCVAFCPAKVLELGPDGKARAARPEECVDCGFCELHCPDFAIMVSPRDKSRGKNGPAAAPAKE
jgi:2-oxoglutarate ferredoxin oxidoreductase subunit delta